MTTFIESINYLLEMVNNTDKTKLFWTIIAAQKAPPIPLSITPTCEMYFILLPTFTAFANSLT